MKSFKEFNIVTAIKGFVGDKIKIERILNREIVVMEYKIEESKFNGKYLSLQIKIKDEMHVVFTGSNALMDQVQQVPKDSFPFTATIIKDNERLQFT